MYVFIKSVAHLQAPEAQLAREGAPGALLAVGAGPVHAQAGVGLPGELAFVHHHAPAGDGNGACHQSRVAGGKREETEPMSPQRDLGPVERKFERQLNSVLF